MTARPWSQRTTRALRFAFVSGVLSLAPGLAWASAWNTAQIDNAGDVGKYTALAVDNVNTVHISYLDATGATLKYATGSGASWTVSAVKPGGTAISGIVPAGTGISISGGYPMISYSLSAGIRTTALTGSAWGAPLSANGNFTPLENQSTSLFTRGSTSHLVFVKNAGNKAQIQSSLFYAQNSGAGWGTPVAVEANSSVTSNSLAVDAGNKAHIAACTATGVLTYYTNASGTWVPTPLAEQAKGSALAIDGDNNLHLAYFKTDKVYYRYKPADGAWGGEVLVADAGTNGGFPAIAVDSQKVPHISFYASTSTSSGNLKYVTTVNGTWQVDPVDASTNAGTYSAIGVDGQGTTYIAYYDVANSALNVAYKRALAASPSPASFGTVDRGFQSEAVAITIANTTSSSVTLSAVAKTGANGDDFTIASDACSNAMLGARSSCTITAVFAPPVDAPRNAPRTAALTIAARAPFAASSIDVALNGTVSGNYLITTSASNGSFAPPIAAVAPGGSQTFTVTPDPGFIVGSVRDGNGELPAPYTVANVSADHHLVATMISPVRLISQGGVVGSFNSIALAYAAANDGWTIQSHAGTTLEALLLKRPVGVTISGGYDGDFATQTGTTAIPALEVSDGVVTLEGVSFQ